VLAIASAGLLASKSELMRPTAARQQITDPQWSGVRVEALESR